MYFCYLERFLIMNLIELKKKQKAVVSNCQEKDLPLKLMEMGCVDGVEIEFMFQAPLGTPFYYKIGNTRIALGKEIVNEIEVVLTDE